MIQRIQTVYLALGALALIALAVLPAIWQSMAADAYAWFAPGTAGAAAAAAAVAIWSIFLYEDRPRQRRMVLGAQLLAVITLLIVYGGFFMVGALDVRPAGEMEWGRLTAMVLPVLAYIFFFLARRGIEKDIELVRSMDRLR